jgi:hypothetical protein
MANEEATLSQAQVRTLTRRQIINALQDDLESLMKEVWEACETSDQADAVKHELEEILAWSRDRESRLGEHPP